MVRPEPAIGEPRVPEPAVVVLVGASGSGKSTWARARYRQQEIVSSDELRGVVGSGRHDLDATDDAFGLLDQIVAARTGRDVAVTVLDLPVVGRDRDDVWRRVERLRGRTPAARYARDRHAATAPDTARRYRELFDRGVSTIFVSVSDLDGPDDVAALEPLTR